MEHLSFGGLLVVALIAVGAPIIVAALRLKIPAPVIEIVAGIIVGPSVLKWAKIDAPISVLALVGVAFLLFLAGLEIDRDPPTRWSDESMTSIVTSDEVP